jgi:hypothetical protein
MTAASARRATQPKLRCGTQARPRMAMPAPSTIWRSFTRLGTAYPKIRTWRTAGTHLRQAMGFLQRRPSLRRCAVRVPLRAYPALPQARRGTRTVTGLSGAAAGSALKPAIPSGPPVNPVRGSNGSALAELSFAAPAQPFQVDYFVEVLALDADGFRSAFTGYTNRSAILVPLPQRPGRYAWRVYTVAKSVPDYVPSAWKYFSVH